MPDQSMIERVARALCDNQESYELNWEAWVHAARAVLREMREPTEAMESAGRMAAINDGSHGWQEMIDAALEDGR